MATKGDGHSELHIAKDKKAKLQGWCSRVMSEAKILLSDQQSNRDVLTGVMNNLKTRYDKYKECCECVIDLTTDGDELDSLFKDTTKFDNEVEILLVKLAQVCVGTSTHQRDEQQYNSRVERQTAKVKLPKLELKHFYGDPLLWPEFWDLYNVAVHVNCEVPIIQKFAHLKSLLSGDAAKCIASIETTESNYLVAVERLQHRYGKKDAQRHRLMTKLTEMKNIDSYKSAREAVDDLTATIRALQVQGVSADEYGALLMPLIETRLPKSWKLEWARKKTETGEVTFSDLITFLEFEVEVREVAERDFTSVSVKKREEINRHEDKYEGNLGTATALHIKPVVKCTFCGNGHKPSECQTHMTVEDRFSKVREAKACFRCALPRHRVANCRWKKRCHCGRIHITQLCTGPRQSQPLNVAATPFNPVQSQTSSIHQAGAYGHGLRMRTVSIRFGQKIARALCDTGSTYSLMSTRMAQSIPHTVIGKKKLRIQTFGNILEEDFKVIRTTAEGVKSPGSLTLEVLVTDAVVGSFEQIDTASVNTFHNYFGKDAVLADIPGDDLDPLDIIIGEDYYDAVVLGRPVDISGGLKATPTIFGWMLHGGQVTSVSANTAYVFRATVQEQLAEFWKLEHLGVSSSELIDRDLEGEIRSSLERDEAGRYVTGWPWKPQSRSHLASNEAVSKRRLQKLLARLSADDYVAYDSEVQNLLNAGYIEKIPQGEIPQSYLPHRGVVKASSATTKLRIVYDASTKSEGKLALNEALEKGPNLLPMLWGTLLRFRLGRVGVVGDLEKAFLQIVLKEDERNVCCFLWQHLDGNIVTYRLTRVFFGATSSPFLLQVTLKHHLENEVEERVVAEALLRNLYVDDTVNSVDSDVEAANFWAKAVEIFQKGGFNLRKFQSNSQNLNFCREDEAVHKVLGVPWCVTTDDLLPIVGLNPTVKRWTKREVASMLAGIYDPLGLVIPVVTPLKCFLQDLWKLHIPWDATLDEDHQKQLSKILLDMEGSEAIAISRWLGTVKQPDPQQIISLHVFTDASCRAYAAVAYLRVSHQMQTVSKLVTAKCRLVPPKGETIPRLELMAILLGSRLLESLKAEFSGVIPIQSCYLWSDSAIALSWVEKGPCIGGVFVANRVREIRLVEARRCWVPGTCNPADLPTRGTSASELNENYLWWNGPNWLCLEEEYWPKGPVADEDDDVTLASVVMTVPEPKLIWLEELVDPTRTSKWKRTLRSLCWMLRWKKPNSKSSVCIEPSEAKYARKLIYRQVQKKLFPSELIALESGEAVFRQSPINSLHPFLHDGIIRMGGRLHQCCASFEEKHPVLLKRCGVVDQLILDVHEQMKHGGASVVISELRHQGAWILRPKKSVSSVIRTCRKCRRFIAAPASEITAPLPDSRVRLSRAFATTGMDLGGPMFLKDGSKVWFVLFTCMTVRAVHLELVSALSEEALVLAVQRFISRRSMPNKWISDHGTNFVALSHWMKNRGFDIEYEFIVERGPWWGGCWERLIQTVKGLLRRSIGKALLTWEQLDTVLKEAEKVINRRPITFQWEGSQTEGVPLPLCPEQFLLPPREAIEEQRDFIASDELQFRKSYFQQLSAVWEREYLWQVLGSKGEIWKSSPNPLQTGEVVLIGDGEKRLNWKLGVVQELHIGRDGHYRAATVRVDRGLLRRPIQKLYKLELTMNDTNSLLSIPKQSATNCTDDAGDMNCSVIPDVCTEDAVDLNCSVPEVSIDTVTTDRCFVSDSCSNDKHIVETTRCGRAVRKPSKYQD